MKKNSIIEVAKTYKLIIENINPGQVEYPTPSWEDMADLLHRTDNPTAEELQNITPKPRDFHFGYYDWNGYTWVRNTQRYNEHMEEFLRQNAIRIAEAKAAQLAEEMNRRGIAKAKGRREILAQALAAIAAAGLAGYLSIEEILQIIDDYYNPEMPQADVPNNFELYQPLANMWSFATTDPEPPYRDPVAP